jgi:phosphoenolpyruvate-protein phosphotransferase (PTS system enzyme I)
MLFRGIGAAPGLALANCLIVQPLPDFLTVPQSISREQAEAELVLYTSAVQEATAQLEAIQMKAQSAGDSTRAEIIGAQMMMLTDPLLEEGVQDRIANQLCSAVKAVHDTTEEQAAILAGLDDPYLQERAADVKDIGQRILAILMGVVSKDLSVLEADTILVGREITPSQMASLDGAKVKGIVAEIGGKTSHTAILANNMEIAAVLGCQGILAAVRDGKAILIDGTQGSVETEITAEAYDGLQLEIRRRKKLQESLQGLIGQPARTLDGFTVELAANIMDSDGATKAEKLGADGIGLYRTEFLFMDRAAPPSEQEQYEAYAKVLRAMNGKPVIIRTMDIGGDKEIAYLKLPKEENPFLGYRAIRICLQDKPLFLTQLRAILRAGIHGRALIMYPMIASLEELQQANQILQEAKDSLRAAGIPFDETLTVGIMVEVPSAAVTADLLIRDAAFFSIGSNDLTQYALAVDRMNERISNLYNHFQPGVLRLIRTVIETANQAGGGKFAGMCGEMASDPLATLLLLGLGMTEFSVNPAALLRIKKIITSVDMAYAQEVAAKAMQLSTAQQIETYLKSALPVELREYLV